MAAIGFSGSDLLDMSAAGLLVAFEGRLDDAGDLRRRLTLDPEATVARLLGEAYLRWETEFVCQLRGDYAFIIWDSARQRVVAARDPFGVRPLHYASFDGQLCVASDVDQIIAAGFPDVAPDDHSVVEFLTREFRTLDRSYFKDIWRVSPGHILVASEGESRTFDYRTVPPSELSFSSTAECHEALRTQIFKAVERRLSSKLPAVVLLSGGVDSTSIACVADSLLRGR